MIDSAIDYVYDIVIIGNGSRYVIVLCGIMIMILAVDKKRRRHTNAYMFFAALASAALLLGMIPELTTKNYNYIMIPLLAVGGMAYLTAEKKDHRAFLFLMLGGATYSMCIHLTSNQGANVISMILTIANVGSIVLLKNVWSEMASGAFGRTCRALICAVIVLQFSMMICSKVDHLYASDAKASELTQTIQEGPYKGLRVTAETEKEYLLELEMVKPLADKSGSIVYMDKDPLYYLATPSLKIGGYSAWLSVGGNNERVVERLLMYYGGDRDRLPTYVFIPEKAIKNNGPLKEQILDRYHYQRVDYDGAAVYRKPEA